MLTVLINQKERKETLEILKLSFSLLFLLSTLKELHEYGFSKVKTRRAKKFKINEIKTKEVFFSKLHDVSASKEETYT